MVNTSALTNTGIALFVIVALSVVSTSLLYGVGLILSHFGLPGIDIMFGIIVIAFLGLHTRQEYMRRYDGGSVVRTMAVSIASILFLLVVVFAGMSAILFVFSAIGYGYVGWWILLLMMVVSSVYLIYAGIYRPIRDDTDE